MTNCSASVRRRSSRTPRPLLASLVPLALVVSGCAAGGSGTTAGDAVPLASSSSSVAPAGTDHHRNDDADHDAGNDAGHDAHGSDLSAVLLRPADLRAGYTSGHAHATAPTGDEPAPDACRPLIELLRQAPAGSHPGGHGDSGDHVAPTGHAQDKGVAVSFTKSHFGPTITQTVVDVGGSAPAAADVRRIRIAATHCPTYVHSTSRIGFNAYEVAELEAPADAAPGAYLRLTATGADVGADTIHWDVWVHDCEGMVVAVTFRSALGGDNADFWPAVAAAMERVHDA